MENLTKEQMEQIAKLVNAQKQRERYANRSAERIEEDRIKRREYMRDYMRNKRQQTKEVCHDVQ